MVNVTRDDALYLLQRKGTLLTLTLAAAFVGVSTLGGLHATRPEFGQLNNGLVTISLAAGVVNTVLALLISPLLFTGVSRLFGADTRLREMLAVTALSSAPGLLAALIGIYLGGLLPLALIGALGGLALFVYGLSLVNGVTWRSALRHTLIMWGSLGVVLVLLMVGIRLLMRLGT